MRNLKRALSAALASVMVLGLMVVGASAASYEDFTDKAEIQHKEAVSMVTELGVIAGLTDGSYGPAMNIDRASFARLVCVTLNGGKEPMLGNLKTTFTDTQGNWAEKYIAYCVDRSIIAGKGNNTFAPSANVTGSEAAKMLLVALGYNPVYEGIGGATWQVTTDVLANQAGLYDDLDGMNTSAPLTRDQAAQMIYNTLNANVVSYSWTLNANGSTIAVQNKAAKTMLEDKFGAVKVEGIVLANDIASVDSGKDAVGVQSDGKTYVKVTNSEDSLNSGSFKVDTGLDMLGKSVILYAKKGSNDSAAKATVLGNVIVSEDNVVATATGSKKPSALASDNDLKLGGKIFVNYAAAEALTLDKDGKNLKGATLTLIDNDDDGKVDFQIQTMKAFGKVTAYSTKSDGNITVTISKSDNTGFAGTFSSTNAADDVEGFADVKKDDYVFVTKINDTMIVEKAKSVTGTVQSIKGSKVTVDGTAYEQSGLVKNVDGTNSLTAALADSLKDEVKLYLDECGYVVMVDDVDSESNYLVVTKLAAATGFGDTKDAKVVLADGTKATVTVNLDDEDYVQNPKENTLYTYSTDKDGNYNLKAVKGGDIELADSKLVKGRVALAKDKDGAVTLKANSSTVFVIGNGDSYKVYTGVANVPNTTVDAKAIVLADVTTGTAEFVYVSDSTAAADSTDKVYVTGDMTVTMDDNGDKVYSWDVVKDGAVITVTGKSTAFAEGKGLYEVEMNGTEVTSDKQIATAATVDEAADGVLTLTKGKTYSYNDATKFITVDGTDLTEASDGTIVTVKDATEESGDRSEVIVVADKDNANLAAYVYIIE
ncbi:S-layer homology domain-containing protein [Pseudoflavonifractor sp. HCP28S3_F10]|uniref:S-layer homology domain-containing protein n=1 Tax=Pseudoflavonifractor sp. HCP28S3_F10 TaxID=3438947 RepID=UPI003F8A1CD9